MEKRAEGKKTAIGAGVLILVVAAMWALGKEPAKAAADLSPDVFKGTLYEGMTEAQAWAAYYQRKAEIADQRAIALAEAAAYIDDPEKVEAEQLVELGITKAELPTYQEFALLVNMQLGGSYVAGALTPPASWTSSVTEWSRHVQQVANTQYHQIYG